MSRVYNFSAGPAVLPEEVLREAAAEMLDYQGSGMSVMEMSHRSINRPKSVQNPREELGSYWGPNRSTKGFAGLTGFPLLSFVLLIHFLHNISCGGFPACTMPCGGKRRQRQDVVVVVALPPTSVAAHQLVGCRLADESAIH